ncbi:ATP-dependent DNA helicase [Insolitispirillum peregrinum]|uniref:ATP-dependent DNA helicase n=1 Tax=Insolitispirillum peregrinum TaxID=80876 RepID=UPI0036218259
MTDEASPPSLFSGPAAASSRPAAPVGDARIVLPNVPVIVGGLRRAAVFTPDGELDTLAPAAAARMARGAHPIVCHMPATATRLGCAPFYAHDVLELFAFARPARFCLPTPRGLCSALALAIPNGLEEEAQALIACVRALLVEISQFHRRDATMARGTAWAMARGGWGWGNSVLAALGVHGEMPHRTNVAAGFRVWDHLPEINDFYPDAPPANQPVSAAEARARLAELLGDNAEARPQQADFSAALTAAFAPRDQQGTPHMVLAEAGTGTGKTLGYIAPASVWAEKNEGCVWVSTYTRNLQRQLDSELDRLHSDPIEKARKVVIRKGRENYLCLLNMEEAVSRLGADPRQAIALGLMARWAINSRDGDMVGGDFPGWLTEVVGRAATVELMDRRGECLFTACTHYNKCFIERAVRKSRRARIVVANHALVMVQAAQGGIEDGSLPTRFVFDEGHHVFDAADSAFSARLSGGETAELRRWLLGAEENGRSRARGLRRRAEDLITSDNDAIDAMDAILQAATCLPGPLWNTRLLDGMPHGPTERFLALVRAQIYARCPDASGPYSLETETDPPVPDLLEAAVELEHALEILCTPTQAMIKALTTRLDTQADELDAAMRLRIESLTRSLERRVLQPLTAWRAMLDALTEQTPDDFVDWFSVDRIEGRDLDVGMHRHWVDPTVPFAKSVAEAAHGLVITSATLRDGSGDAERDWQAAEARSGGIHLPSPPVRSVVASPFPYPDITRVLVVSDVRKDDLAQVAAAYRELFLAANGGGLGLFTAISRLRAVHQRIAPALDDAEIPLYAQHVDGMDVSTLVDIFRAERHSCLLGTDAVRDGVDVPGDSLRLIVFDRVPWPRPDILHKARRNAFGGRSYDDRLARLKLKQAFGRLVRRSGDRGVFVLLDPMMPSRLHGAFPEGVSVERVGLAEAVRLTRQFFQQQDD